MLLTLFNNPDFKKDKKMFQSRHIDLVNNFNDNDSMSALVLSTKVGGSMIKILPLESLIYFYFIKVIVRMESGGALDYFLKHPFASAFQYHTEKYQKRGTTTKAERRSSDSGPFQVTNDFVHEYYIINKHKSEVNKYLTAHASFLIRLANNKLKDLPIEQFMSVWWFVYAHCKRISNRNVSTTKDTNILTEVLKTKMSQSPHLQGKSLEKYYLLLQHDFIQMKGPGTAGPLNRILIELYHIYYGNANSKKSGNVVNERLHDTVTNILGE